jgi:hypothetical protein
MSRWLTVVVLMLMVLTAAMGLKSLAPRQTGTFAGTSSPVPPLPPDPPGLLYTLPIAN